MVVRIHHHHAILVINPQARGQLKFAEAAALLSEVIQKISGVVEDLHHPAHRFDHVEMALGVNPNSLWAEHLAAGIANAADGVAEISRAIQYLHPRSEERR